MPATPNVPSNPGGGSAPAPGGPTGTLQGLFGGQPLTQQVSETTQPAVAPPAQPPTQQEQPAPSAAPVPAQAQPVVEDTTEDIEPEVDPAEAANGAVLRSYQTALKKANSEARNLRTKLQAAEATNEQLTTANKALQAQVVPTQQELAFYRAIHEDGTDFGSVLYPGLLWQAIAPLLQWDSANKPTNLQEALTKARAQYKALFTPVPQVNGGAGGAEPGKSGGNFMNDMIRGGLR